MLLYIDPNQVTPLYGVAGTIVGLALMFWVRICDAARKVISYFSSKSRERT